MEASLVPAPLALEPFGALLAVGLALGVLLAWRLGLRSELPLAPAASALVPAAVAALAGARVFYVIGSSARERLLEILALGGGGLSGFGALMAGTAVFAGSLRLNQQPVSPWLDAAAPAALLAAAVGRLGCYLAGCDAGVRLAAPGGVATRLGAFSHAASPLHPTQLYEGGLLLALALLLAFGTRWKRRHGDVFLAAALAYAAVRAGLEPLRADLDRGFFGPFSATLCCATATVLVIAGLLARRAQRLPSST